MIRNVIIRISQEIGNALFFFGNRLIRVVLPLAIVLTVLWKLTSDVILVDLSGRIIHIPRFDAEIIWLSLSIAIAGLALCVLASWIRVTETNSMLIAISGITYSFHERVENKILCLRMGANPVLRFRSDVLDGDYPPVRVGNIAHVLFQIDYGSIDKIIHLSGSGDVEIGLRRTYYSRITGIEVFDSEGKVVFSSNKVNEEYFSVEKS